MINRFKSFLNTHWRYLVFTALVLGFAAWILHGWLALGAYENFKQFGEYSILVNYNVIGEGDFELFVFIPAMILLSFTALYVFSRKYWESLHN